MVMDSKELAIKVVERLEKDETMVFLTPEPFHTIHHIILATLRELDESGFVLIVDNTDD